jgi:hypothetical protein
MRVQDLLTDESKWTRFVFCRPNGAGDMAYCVAGAINRCYPCEGGSNAAARRAVLRLLGTFTISEWNDHPDTTFADIRRVIEQADI